MKRASLHRAALSVLFAGALAACSGAAEPVTSDTRIVSLGGDLTEIVYALEEADKLVARDSTSAFPPSVQSLPDVGYVRTLNAEGILALSPTLVIASPDAGPPEALDQLRAAGVEIVVPPSGYSQESLLARIDRIGAALDREDAALALASELSRKIDDAVRNANSNNTPKILFLLNGRDGSPMAAGRETAADAMISLAGGRNVFDSHSGYKAYSFEAMAAAEPDVIMMMEHSLAQMGGVDALRNHPAIGLTPAGRNGRIVAADGTFLLGFGPRLPEAITFVADGFHAQHEPEPK